MKRRARALPALAVDEFPPFMKGGLIEALLACPGFGGRRRFPPFMKGGLIEAQIASCSAIALEGKFPPFMKGGLIEALLACPGFGGRRRFPPFMKGGLIEAVVALPTWQAFTRISALHEAGDPPPGVAGRKVPPPLLNQCSSVFSVVHSQFLIGVLGAFCGTPLGFDHCGDR